MGDSTASRSIGRRRPFERAALGAAFLLLGAMTALSAVDAFNHHPRLLLGGLMAAVVALLLYQVSRSMRLGLEAEAEAKRFWESSSERAHFLAELSTTLSASLDLDKTLEQISAVLVPRFADLTSIMVVDAQGELRRVAEASVAPDAETAVRGFRDRPAAFAPGHPLLEVFRSRQAVHFDDYSAWAAEQPGVEADYLELLRKVQPRSALFVPMVSEGRAVGAISLAMLAHSGRAFGPSDLSMGREIAARAALAISHAGLYQQAQQAIRLRDDFLAIAGHELRTPLTSLLLQAQAMQRAPDGFPASQQQRLNRVVQSGLRLDRLVQELLDVARLEAGKFALDPQPMNLTELVSEVVRRFHDGHARTPPDFRLALEPDVNGDWDRNRLDQVVTNLVANALKYGAGKPVGVTLERREGSAWLVVEDQGIGVAPEDHVRIFERFERAVRAREYGGLGIGLWIVREIVERSGGAVSVRSAEGEGATFTVRLPLAA